MPVIFTRFCEKSPERLFRNILSLTIMSVLILFSRCKSKKPENVRSMVIFHAGSLSIPFRAVAAEYEKRHPGVKILMEPAGSLVCARKITEMKKPCDIIASADYFVINEFIVPEHSDWSIRFATNEIVIAFRKNAKYSSEIDSSNWMDILLRDDVTYARSDPDSDPCGYRSVLAFRLAEKYYGREGLADMLTSKDREFIRPKEADLVWLVESNAVDYMLQYKSVAIQHNLEYIKLPDHINLGNPGMNDIYKGVTTDVTGTSPGSRICVRGEYINYSIAVLSDSHEKDLAVDFVAFLISSEGRRIFKDSGQDPIVPFITEQPEKLPLRLLRFLNTDKQGEYRNEI